MTTEQKNQKIQALIKELGLKNCSKYAPEPNQGDRYPILNEKYTDQLWIIIQKEKYLVVIRGNKEIGISKIIHEFIGKDYDRNDGQNNIWHFDSFNDVEKIIYAYAGVKKENMEQEFREWLEGQRTTNNKKYDVNALVRDLKKTIPNWSQINCGNIFEIIDVSIIAEIYKRCSTRGDLNKKSMGVGRGRPMLALKKYKEFLSQNTNTQCTWVAFFNELSSNLVDKSPQELSTLLTQTFSQFKDKVNFPEQIDPFSFFSKIISVGSHTQINKSTDKRRIALTFLKQELDIQAELPQDYCGVPTSMAMKVFLFPVNQDYKQDVLLLCKLFKQSQENKIQEQIFNRALNIKQVAYTKLTQALFWTNPENHFPVDRQTKPYFNLDNFSKDYQGYQQVLQEINQHDKSHCQLSFEAWQSDGEKPMDERLQKTINLLKSKNQIILQGSPGTGKTRLAIELAYYLLYDPPLSNDEEVRADEIQEMNEESLTDGQYKLIQFHPAYSYEDFVRGIMASNDENGNISYETKNKVLAEMAENARKDPDSDFVLVIDEINRANLSAVLGELIYALEYRGQPVESMYAIGDSREIILPENLYIIGTMNTADRSVGHIDYAIRRRFAFVDVKTDESVIPEAAKILFAEIKQLFDDKLSEEFDKDDVMIGHSYFLGDDLAQALKYEIKPILYEYVKDGVLTCTKDTINALNVN